MESIVTASVTSNTEIATNIVQVVAILGAAIWATFQFKLYRFFAPQGTITHRISHRILEDARTHISVTVVLSNTGQVKWRITPKPTPAPSTTSEDTSLKEKPSQPPNHTRVLLIRPFSLDEPMQFDDPSQGDFPEPDGDGGYLWTELDRKVLVKPIEIEPSGLEELSYEFILNGAVESILIYSIYNFGNQGLQCSTVYDVSQDIASFESEPNGRGTHEAST